MLFTRGAVNEGTEIKREETDNDSQAYNNSQAVDSIWVIESYWELSETSPFLGEDIGN